MRRRTGLALLAAAVVLMALVVIGCGRGGESQFSPDTFELRGVTHFSIPYAGVRLVEWPGEPHRPRIVQFWIDEGYLAEPSEPSRTWHVITGWKAWRRWHYSGRAKAFWYQCDCRDGPADEWIKWSRQYPELAERLWPQVIRLLQRTRKGGGYAFGYDAAAYLMREVRDTTGEASFDGAVARWRESIREWPEAAVRLGVE